MGRGKGSQGRRPPPPAPVDIPPTTGLRPDASATPMSPMAQGARLSRRERLRGKPRIDALFVGGRVGMSRRVTARAMPSPFPLLRVAFLVGKAAGKAHVRNRLRRRLRALYRERKWTFPLPSPTEAGDGAEAEASAPEFVHRGWDVVVLPRRGALEADAATLGHDLDIAIRRALGDAP